MDTKVMFLDSAQPQTGVTKRPPPPTPSGAFNAIVRREMESLAETSAKIREELDELNTLMVLMAGEVRGANERAAKAIVERDHAREVAAGILVRRQFELGPLRKLLDELKFVATDARLEKLIRNVELSLKCS